MTLFGTCQAQLARLGLAAAGFHPKPEDHAPANARTLVIAMAVPPAMWAQFAASPEAADAQPNPLDRWSRRVLERAAERLGAAALFPFGGPPYLPFLQWAQRAAPLWQSPVGMSVHAEYGLWFSCRGALAFAERLVLPEQRPAAQPCRSCMEQFCRHACPAGAFTAQGYDAERCAAHVRSPEGALCRTAGCQVRHACPVGTAFAHSPAQAAFHMDAFLNNRPALEPEPTG